LYVESGDLGVGDLDAFRIVTFIEATGDGERCVRGGAGDQLDNDQVADQRLATPVLGDEGEQPMLYLVPLAGAGWDMTDGDLDSKFVGQHLQFALPQAQARAVAAATVGIDQHLLGIRITRGADFVPPVSNARDRELSGVSADADIDESGIGGNVVDAVRHRLAELRNGEVVHPDRRRLPPSRARSPLGPQLTAAVLEACPRA
jgi:hypothetical protein